MSRPSKLWRIVLPSTDGPVHRPYPSEAATRRAVEAEKTSTTANCITVEKRADGHWGEWLRWVRTDEGWIAQ
ncbi:hypothetical protein [Streptomyces californicus]|uniref:hypothetical protein n=1 Tax=Streptomyces californicus TaxID=67351 RepID=UPI0037A5C50A